MPAVKKTFVRASKVPTTVKKGPNASSVSNSDPTVNVSISVEQSSAVDHPAHYNAGSIECIDAIREQLTAEEYRGFLKGQVAKYTWRERLKNGPEDIKKAAWYITELLNFDARSAAAEPTVKKF